MPFKIWVEIEEVDEDGDEINPEIDYSFNLPFASSARCETLEEAEAIATTMHLAVNTDCVYP